MRWRGYYFANSAQYGRAWREVKRYSTVYADWEHGEPVPMLFRKKMWVDLNLGGARNEELQARLYLGALRSRWRKVIAVQLTDEPRWSRFELVQNARMVRRLIRELGLPPRPIGATFSWDAIMNSSVWTSPELDWIGPEFYLRREPGDSVRTIPERMAKTAAALVKRIGARQMIPTIQAYDQRRTADPASATWTESEVVAMQEPAYRAAHSLGKQALLTLWFSYRRPGGTADLPLVKAEHRRLVNLLP